MRKKELILEVQRLRLENERLQIGKERLANSLVESWAKSRQPDTVYIVCEHAHEPADEIHKIVGATFDVQLAAATVRQRPNELFVRTEPLI